MPESSAASAPPKLPRRGLERLDLLLLCVEALDLNGGEGLVWMSEQMGYSGLFPNRVELWKRRCHNPLRRTTRRGELEPAETDALIRLLCALADRLYPLVRALLATAEPESIRQQRWDLFQARLSELVRERMNLRRVSVQTLLHPQRGSTQRRHLIQTLSLAAGTGGFERLRASLCDPVA